MDVEFEEVVERVRHRIYGAIYAAFYSILQFKRLIGFRTGCKWYVLKVLFGVLDMLARFSTVTCKHEIGQVEVAF